MEGQGSGFLRSSNRTRENKEKEKVKDILDQSTLKEVKDVQKFLGLASYYYWFIKDFAVITRPLYDLIKKDQKWDWMEK